MILKCFLYYFHWLSIISTYYYYLHWLSLIPTGYLYYYYSHWLSLLLLFPLVIFIISTGYLIISTGYLLFPLVILIIISTGYLYYYLYWLSLFYFHWYTDYLYYFHWFIFSPLLIYHLCNYYEQDICRALLRVHAGLGSRIMAIVS